MDKPVVVVDYDEQWPERFEELAGPLRDALAGLDAAVEHVGSTAVPGLAAKPVIDIDVVVGSREAVESASRVLERHGYILQGDLGIIGREAFRAPPTASPHHLYVVVAGTKPHHDHVRFRDLLRAQPEVAAEYGALKLRLAREHRDDRAGYLAAKANFVERTLQVAAGQT